MRLKLSFAVLLLFALFSDGASAEPPREDFFKMIASGDVAGVKLAILSGFEVNALYGDKYDKATPLWWAISQRRAEIVGK
jgi:hypothetical protein